MFPISSRISQFKLMLDQKKTPVQLVVEMEKHFYFQDVVMTSIFLRIEKPNNVVEFRTYDAMFDTINSALYQMLEYEGRVELIKEVLGREAYGYNCDYGWDFPESLLPYMKQLIYKAIEAHDLRAPEDRVTPPRYGERVIVRIG